MLLQDSNHNANNNANTNSNMKRIYSTRTTIKLLKTLFENENYYFSSFPSKDQDSIKPVQLNGDPVLNEFFLSIDDINDDMIKYEIYSIQSLKSITNANAAKSIWLPKFMIIDEAHCILSTILYSSNIDKIPVDLDDYVLIYENIKILLENQSKELYEEILKISFRLLIIHKSQLLLSKRQESKPLFTENESISILQLMMFHLITKIPNQLQK